MSSPKKIAGLLLAVVASSNLCGAERPTLNLHTRDPRPDILPHPFYQLHTEYRLKYNRPRNFSGFIARVLAPTSQEAMVWVENQRAGAYDRHHLPPRYKRYFSPKPWEVLLTDARPDFPEGESTNDGGNYTAPYEPEVPEEEITMPDPLQKTSSTRRLPPRLNR